MIENKEIVYTILEIIILICLLFLFSNGGVIVFFGEAMTHVIKIIVQFGIFVINASGALVGCMLPTRRHRIFRDTQVHTFKYLGVSGLFQMMILFITEILSKMDSNLIAQIPPNFPQLMVFTYAMLAFYMAFNYFKSLFTHVKSVEYRDPRDIFRQLFG